MTEAATAQPAAGNPPNNSPFAAPVPPETRAADAATARENAQVTTTRVDRADLAEAARIAQQTPQDRYLDARDGMARERLGDRKLSSVEWEKLTFGEKQTYAERFAERANKGSDPSTSTDPNKPAEPEARVKVGELELTETELRGLMERKGLEESRKLTLPSDPSKYELTLPSDFKAPQGIEYNIDANHPAAALAKQFAHEVGLNQEQFSRLLAIHGSIEVQQVANLKAARDAEVAKLGATAVQRISAAETFLRGHLGDDLGKTMSNMMVTAKHVEGFERLMQKLAGGASSFSAGHRSPEDARPRISDADWSKMTYHQQKEYSANANASASSGRR